MIKNKVYHHRWWSNKLTYLSLLTVCLCLGLATFPVGLKSETATEKPKDDLSTPRDIAREFYHIEMTTKDKPMHDQFTEYDVYSDVHPFVDTAVWLGNKTKDNYINANYIQSAYLEDDALMIAAQGPMANTAENFWRMVL